MAMKRQPWFLVLGLVLGASACAPMSVGPSERVGLGTSWGETRESNVRMVSFERDDPDRPFMISTLRYDDPEGLRALARLPLPITGAGPEADAATAGGPVRVNLVDERGFSLPTFWRGGQALVEGRRGQRYAIEIFNGTRERIEAVGTVDGRDVMD